MAEETRKPMSRILVQVDGPPAGRTMDDLRHVAELISGKPVEKVERVLVLETTKAQLSSQELSQVVDEGKTVPGIKELAQLREPSAKLSLDDVLSKHGVYGSTPAGAVAERRIIVVVIIWGPIVIVWIPEGPIIIVVVGW